MAGETTGRREIAYTIRFPEAAAHRVEVELLVPVEGDGALAGAADRGHVELMLPVWTPGSYLVREFARQVETIAASTLDGTPLAVEKSRKNRWRVATGGAAEVVVRYRLYARDMSVRATFVDAGFALLNGAAAFLTRVDAGRPAAVPHRVTLELPAGWPVALCALPRVDGPAGASPAAAPATTVTFLAADYDALVDAPIYAGDPTVQRFTVESAEIELVGEGVGAMWDPARAARDLEAIVHAQAALWGGLPFGRFLFLNLLTEGGGGLEHENSTVLMTSRWKAGTAKGWQDWLGLASHELFHAWNGKRLRPVELGPFDYEAEVTTRSLWFVEGVTSYYDDLLVRRAGLASDEEYLRRLSEVIERIETTPGRELQSLAEASWDAWIKFYRRDENSANHTVSYYEKGALVAWLLDARLRAASGDAKSLDDLLRLAFSRFSGDRGYATEDLYALAAELGGDAVGGWLREAVEGTGALDYRPALDGFGLRFGTKADDGDGETGGRVTDGGAAPAAKVADDAPAGGGAAAPGDGGEPSTGGRTAPAKTADDAPAEGGTAPVTRAAGGGPSPGRAWIGLTYELRDGRLVVSEIRRGTPAFEAGVNVGDELLAIDGYRLPARGLADRLACYRPGQSVELTIARRERLGRLPLTLGSEPVDRWRLEPDPAANAGQRARRAAWLGG